MNFPFPSEVPVTTEFANANDTYMRKEIDYPPIVDVWISTSFKFYSNFFLVLIVIFEEHFLFCSYVFFRVENKIY